MLIGEGGQLISNILEISNIFNFWSYIVNTDNEKKFDSLSMCQCDPVSGYLLILSWSFISTC